MKNRYAAILIISIIMIASASVSILFGIEFTDTGFIEALSYRIYNGQNIYTDFDYVRPPLTPWIWHFPFYVTRDTLEVFIRSLVVIEDACTSYFVYRTLKILNVDHEKQILSGVLTFAFLLHWLPSVPWHTTDGLFFTSGSALLFASGRVYEAAACATLERNPIKRHRP